MTDMQLDILSDDVLREILLFLRIEDLPSVLLANRYLNQIVDSETQWRLLYLLLATPITPKKDDDIKAIVESLSKVSVDKQDDDDEDDASSSSATSNQVDKDKKNGPLLQQPLPPKDKMFPHESWKYNVQMTRHHRWSSYFIDSEGNKIMNSTGPIIDESGKILRFAPNINERIYRIANTVRPINTRGKTRIDLKVQMCCQDKSKADNAHSFCSSWSLPGIIEESILRDIYVDGKHKSVYLGEFTPGENVGYANNGYFFRNKQDKWTDKFYSGDVLTFIVDAEHEYEAAKESKWEKPYGLLTCLLNGAEADTRSYSGIFANPQARIYFCTQVNEALHESGIVTTIQYS